MSGRRASAGSSSRESAGRKRSELRSTAFSRFQALDEVRRLDVRLRGRIDRALHLGRRPAREKPALPQRAVQALARGLGLDDAVVVANHAGARLEHLAGEPEVEREQGAQLLP